MIHTILYLGRLDLDLERLHHSREDFKILRPDNKGLSPVDMPSRKVNGIVFGYMENSQKGLDYDHKFFAVKVGDVVLEKRVPLVRRLHTDGKGFGPRASLFGDESAQRLLRDIVQANPEQKTALMRIYDRFFQDSIPFLPEEIGEEEARKLFEGAKRQILVNAYERNPEARRKCMAHYGARCIICEFDFARRYGEVGENFIHVHHVRELSEISQKYEVDPIRDLRPVCPNCHAIIHRNKPAYSIQKVKEFITTSKKTK